MSMTLDTKGKTFNKGTEVSLPSLWQDFGVNKNVALCQVYKWTSFTFRLTPLPFELYLSKHRVFPAFSSSEMRLFKIRDGPSSMKRGNAPHRTIRTGPI
jgi:hypothetical protein